MRSILLALLLLATPVHAGDWPQWLGPTRDNRTPQTVAPFAEPPAKLWSVPVGEGNSSPVVAGDRVFLHTKVKDRDVEAVTAFNAKTGEVVWTKTYDKAPFKPPYGEGPRATPLVDGGKLYTFGNTGMLVCWDAATGKQLWSSNTLQAFAAPNITFGITSSPLILGDKLVVMVGNDAKKPAGAGLVCYDKNSGERLWQALNDLASYASPVLLDKELVALTGENLLAVNPEDGKLQWKHPFKDLLLESSTTPVKVGDTYLASSITRGTVALKVERPKGKPAEVKTLWSDAALTGYFSTPVAVGDTHVYLVAGKLVPPQFATLHCVEIATGKKVWSKERVGKYHASLMRLGDGKVLMLDDSGNLVLLGGATDKYEELARAPLFKANGDAWAHPALVDGKLFIRDGKSLMCFELKGK